MILLISEISKTPSQCFSKRDDTAVTHEMMNDWVDESWIENEDGWLEED